MSESLKLGSSPAGRLKIWVEGPSGSGKKMRGNSMRDVEKIIKALDKAFSGDIRDLERLGLDPAYASSYQVGVLDANGDQWMEESGEMVKEAGYTLHQRNPTMSRHPLDKGGKVKGYIAFYKGKKMEVKAISALSARDIAAEKFRARRPYDVEVVLAEKGGKQVTHMPMFASEETPMTLAHILESEGLKLAKEHASPEALKKYLKEHPDADPKNHTVKGEGKDEGGSDDEGPSQEDFARMEKSFDSFTEKNPPKALSSLKGIKDPETGEDIGDGGDLWKEISKEFKDVDRFSSGGGYKGTVLPAAKNPAGVAKNFRKVFEESDWDMWLDDLGDDKSKVLDALEKSYAEALSKKAARPRPEFTVQGYKGFTDQIRDLDVLHTEAMELKAEIDAAVAPLLERKGKLDKEMKKIHTIIKEDYKESLDKIGKITIERKTQLVEAQAELSVVARKGTLNQVNAKLLDAVTEQYGAEVAAFIKTTQAALQDSNKTMAISFKGFEIERKADVKAASEKSAGLADLLSKFQDYLRKSWKRVVAVAKNALGMVESASDKVEKAHGNLEKALAKIDEYADSDEWDPDIDDHPARYPRYASDRSTLIRMASELPKGSDERRAILAGLGGVR